MTMSAMRADRVDRTADPAASASAEERQPRTAAPMPAVVMPQVQPPSALSGGKTVHELHSLIEEAMGLLAKERESEAVARPVDEAPADKRVLGAPPGSEIRYASSLASRVFKTIVGLAVAFVAGVVPLKGILTPSSTEAFVNAPLYSVRAPVDGRFVSDKLIVGAPVAPGERLGEIERTVGANGSAAALPLTIANAGKVWDVLIPSGFSVARGDEIARIVACSAASVTAAVPETVYDKLSSGMPARFHFFGSDFYFAGRVANMLGRSAPAGNLAIPPASLTADTYRVIVAVPDLGAIPNCAVGRRGEIIFGKSVL
jgi:HlyD family secretion protein